MTLVLPLRFAPDVSHTDPRYVAGFSAGFIAPRHASPKLDVARAYRAGFFEGQAGIRVPQWRWERHEAG